LVGWLVTGSLSTVANDFFNKVSPSPNPIAIRS
jgi:hypothetical protein